MKKTKRRALYIIAALLGALFVLSCLVGFAACGGSDEHVHTWDAGEITTAATCEGTGVRTYTCTECGETKTETIHATGHTWDEGTVTKEATAEAEGEMTYTCTVCGATKTEKIDKIESSGDDDEGNEPGTGGEGGDENPSGGDDNPNEPDVPETEIATEVDLIEALAEGGKVTIADDIVITTALEVEADTTLDLAGKSLSTDTNWTSDTGYYKSEALITVEKGATLTVTDSGTGTTGGSISYDYSTTDLIDANGQVYTDTANVPAGTTTYGWNSSVYNAAAIEVEAGGSLVLESGTISSSSVGVRVDGVREENDTTTTTTVTISGGTIESEYYTIWASGDTTVTITDGTIAGTSKGLFVAGDDKFGYGEVQSGTTTLNVQGGTISCEKDSAICTIGNTSGDHKVINISGGKIIGPDLYDEETQMATPMPAIYNASGNLTISGTAEITGSTAVEHRGGNLTISGGTLISSYKGAQNLPAYKGSGATSYGYSLAIYPFQGGSVAWNKTMAVAVSGGTFTGDIYVANNVLNGDDQDQSITASISISGITISGMIVLADASELDLADILGEEFTVTVTAFDEFAWAMTLDDATVILGADIETDSLSTIYVHGTITLDLNGFTLKQTASGSNGWGLICVEDGGNLTIEDTSTEGTGAIDVAAYYALTVKGSQDAAKTKLTIESGTIECWGYVISTNASAKDGVRIYGNVEITVNGGTLTSTNNQAIYLTAGKLTVNGGTITGDTGIEIRGGHADVTGGTIDTNVEVANTPDTGVTGQSVSSGYSIAVTWNSSYSDGTLTIDMSKVSMNGMIYMKNTEDASSVLTDTDATWGNYDRVIGKRGNDDKLYYMDGVAFDGSEATATLADDGYTYVISGTSAAMTQDQLRAFWTEDGVSEHIEGTDYIAIAVVAGIGETVTITTHNGDVYTTEGGTKGNAKPFVINVTDYDEDTSEFFMNVVVTDSDGNLKAAYVITLGEITSSTAQQQP